nr:MAG TPA_asm: hypothetical protein [Caudoviricetes sp.]
MAAISARPFSVNFMFGVSFLLCTRFAFLNFFRKKILRNFGRRNAQQRTRFQNFRGRKLQNIV